MLSNHDAGIAETAVRVSQNVNIFFNARFPLILFGGGQAINFEPLPEISLLLIVI